MVITGTLKAIIYQNTENGYTVFVLETIGGQDVTAVGVFPILNVGENLELEGQYVLNKTYGEQFKVNHAKIIAPKTTEGIQKYLSSGLIKGVGEVTAKNIVDYFGNQTLEVIEFTPARLSEVRGISANKAMLIAESYAEVKDMQNTIMFLQEYGITAKMAVKIFDTYRDRTLEILQNNPYKLVEDISGIGFATADKIASKLGIPFDSAFRVRAGLLHILGEASNLEGHTYLPKEIAKERLNTLLQIDEEKFLSLLESVIADLEIDGKIVCTKIFEDDAYILRKFYNTEKNLAKKLLSISDNSQNLYDCDEDIAEFERINKIEFHDQQKQAVKLALSSNTCVITGGPGTGKTTIIRCILTLFRQRHKSVLLLAPTGRASKRMSEATGVEAKTIHRALEVNFVGAEDAFYYNENNKLTSDVVIVDEVSMVDAMLLNSLIKALKSNAQLILVGDKDQLPSVGAGNVLGDILNSGKVNYVCLTEIYRQAKESLIILNAHAVNSGKMPTINNQSKDFFFKQTLDAGQSLSDILDFVTKRLPAYCGIEPSKIQVLAPMKNGACGVERLNVELQKLINPPDIRKAEIGDERVIFRYGDKVMQIVNDYELEWYKMKDEGGIERGTGVFNGDIGKIVDINIHERKMVIMFEDGRMATYDRTQSANLVLSYAITIHKSQGSEFDVVVMPIIGGASKILTRNLLYTAITRAKKIVVLVGSKFYLSRMVQNNYTAKRYTTLKYFLQTLSNESTINSKLI